MASGFAFGCGVTAWIAATPAIFWIATSLFEGARPIALIASLAAFRASWIFSSLSSLVKRESFSSSLTFRSNSPLISVIANGFSFGFIGNICISWRIRSFSWSTNSLRDCWFNDSYASETRVSIFWSRTSFSSLVNCVAFLYISFLRLAASKISRFAAAL